MAAFSGPGTPYITPAVLRRAPTGIDWTSIPNSRSSTLDQAAEQVNICMRATGSVDIAANQVLRATVDTEYFTGPDWRMTVRQNTGETRLLCSRWPILQVLQCQFSPAGFYPRQYQTVQPQFLDIEYPAIGVYGTSAPADSADGGQTVLVAPGASWAWWGGRNSVRAILRYISGWPHTSLTGGIAQGVTQLPVDDVTGWGPPPVSANNPQFSGAIGILYDGLQQEVFTCTGVASQTTLTATPSAGTFLLNVVSGTVVLPGAWIQIDTGALAEIVQVLSSTANTITLQPSSPVQIPNHASNASVFTIAGPGTLNIATATGWPHSQQTLVTTMPQTIINAAIDFASAQALERGANATVIQSMSGGGGGQGGPVTAEQLMIWATDACRKFARVI